MKHILSLATGALLVGSLALSFTQSCLKIGFSIALKWVFIPFEKYVAPGELATVIVVLIEVICVAVPFGLIYGLFNRRRLVVSAAITGLLTMIVFFGWREALVDTDRPYWWITPLEIALFTLVFAGCAVLSSKMASSWISPKRAAFAAALWAALSIAFISQLTVLKVW